MRNQQLKRKLKRKMNAAKNSEGVTEEGISSNTDCDQDSEVSFMGDIDEDIDSTEIEEDWIEYLKRSTRLAEEKMRTAKIPCWIMTHTKMKWKLAVGISTTEKSSKMESRSPSSSCEASRAVGRPRKRWEDDISQFLKPVETEEIKGNDLKNSDTWMQVAKDQIRWKEIENYIRNKSERC